MSEQINKTPAKSPKLSSIIKKKSKIKTIPIETEPKNKNINIGDNSIKQDDLFLVGDAELDQKGLIYHHIASANDLYINGIPYIITQSYKIEKEIINQRDSTQEDKQIEKIFVDIKFTDVFISKPTKTNYYSGKEEVIFPNAALLEEKTYSGNLRVNAKIDASAYLKDGTVIKRSDTVKNFKLCRVPILVNSDLCNKVGLSKEALVKMHEDPTDPGGYFIIKGVEWVIDCLENVAFNQIRIFKNEGYSKEVMRVEFISKPGDSYQNSEYFLVRLFNDKQLTCEIARNQLKGMNIPFYVLFRILGWTSDKEIFDNIVYGYEDSMGINMVNILIESMRAKYTQIPNGEYVYKQTDAVRLISDTLKNTDFKYLELDTNPNNYQIAFIKVMKIVDLYCFPHIGTKPEDRINKMRYLALIIRKLLLVKMGNMEPTDRDTYKTKRIHAAGTSYAKSFKTYFNASIIQQINRRLVKDFKSMPFSQVDLASSVKSSVYGADFERAIMQAITSGNKSQITVSSKTRINRLSSQLLDRKNQIAMYSTLRQVSAPSSDSSKQSERANEMRRVHMSCMGYICIITSPDGERVGINKQIALFASIICATSSDVIKNILIRDASIIPFNDTTPEKIYTERLRNVYINGDWIGCTKDSLELVNKYRQLRRDFTINPLTTIYWDNTQDEAFFWVDVGRIIRPLIIVYNNKRDPKRFPNKKYTATTFEQGIGIDSDIINKLKQKIYDIDYLLSNNLIEYISAEEQENCYICPYYDRLTEDKNNELCEYTHCDIPQSLIGLAALTSPFSHHNQIPRIIFQARQATQTCGIFTLNWPYRCDKDTFLQYICETPLVKTVAYKYIHPNGCNTIVAIACYTGYNQEDSLIISQGAIDRGLFDGSKFTFYKTELEQKEEFGNPDIASTADIKASYSKLKNGKISRGAKLNKGDAIIGKYMKIPKDSTNHTMIDRSTIYKEDEEAIVHSVINSRNEDDERFIKVGIRKRRPVMVGDKFCLTPDHEVLTDNGWKNIVEITKFDRVATLNNNIIEFHTPTELLVFDHNDDICYVQNSFIDIQTTLNHKMYVKKKNNAYKLLEANMCKNQTLYYKKDGINKIADIEMFTIPVGPDELPRVVDMNIWLEFLGIYISKGYIENNHIKIQMLDMRGCILIYILNTLKFKYEQSTKDIYTNVIIYDDDVCQYIASLGNNTIGSYVSLPTWCYTMSMRQSLILLQELSKFGYYDKRDSSYILYANSKQLCDGIQILSIMAGRSSRIINDITSDTGAYKLYISNFIFEREPIVYPDDYKIRQYTGNVYCITVPNSIFMIRNNMVYAWNGNSSRSGQKGVVGLLLRDSDMPYTKDGMRPSIIMNPHAIPSRMTIGQLYESQVGNWCAKTGTYTDGTIFKNVDIETIASELEAIGMDRYGYHRLYSGITGEFIDSLIFMGPTYYQRLQKFVIDKVRSVTQGPSDVLSRQPIDKMSSGGGIRIGEMERDVICSHGASKFLQEKYFNHSDGFTEYICRCGKTAIVNVAKNYYKCKYCKDNADISEFQTSWSSKLFIQELETMNIGIRRHVKPFTYESIQEESIKNVIS